MSMIPPQGPRDFGVVCADCVLSPTGACSRHRMISPPFPLHPTPPVDYRAGMAICAGQRDEALARVSALQGQADELRAALDAAHLVFGAEVGQLQGTVGVLADLLRECVGALDRIRRMREPHSDENGALFAVAESAWHHAHGHPAINTGPIPERMRRHGGDDRS